MEVTKTPGEEIGKVVLMNFITARPPQRTQFDIGDWRVALDSAEMMHMPNRVKLYDMYSDAILDPHLSRQWAKRVENITNTEWGFSIAEKEDEEMKQFCDSPEFEDLLTEIMLHIAYGITVAELGLKEKAEYGETVNRLSIYSVKRKHVRPENGTIVKEQYDSSDVNTNAINYREGRYLDYVAEIGKPDDLGILLNVVPYVILKKGAVSDWALFVQLFGQPFREYRYDGFDDKVRIQLEQSAQDMASAPYIILPDGAQVTLHEIKNNNTGEVHSKLVDYCDKMISIYILGNTLTTDNGKVGSNALGEVHSDTQDDVYAADKRKVRRILNNIIRPILYNLGLPVKGGIFHPKEQKDLKEILDRLKVVKEVKALGEPVESDFIYETSGVPKPENYDSLKSEMEAQAEADSGNPPAPGKPSGKTNKKPQKKVTLSAWNNLRFALADFFDPAP